MVIGLSGQAAAQGKAVNNDTAVAATKLTSRAVWRGLRVRDGVKAVSSYYLILSLGKISRKTPTV
jgi:hypothetical protein